MAKALILVLRDANAIMRDSRVVLGVGMLLSLLSNFLGCWVEQAPNEKAEAAVKQQIAQHAAGEQAEAGVGGRRHSQLKLYVVRCLWGDDRLWQGWDGSSRWHLLVYRGTGPGVRTRQAPQHVLLLRTTRL
jgi:hypothetical protein